MYTISLSVKWSLDISYTRPHGFFFLDFDVRQINCVVMSLSHFRLSNLWHQILQKDAVNDNIQLEFDHQLDNLNKIKKYA